jgi:hypothetical protein
MNQYYLSGLIVKYNAYGGNKYSPLDIFPFFKGNVFKKIIFNLYHLSYLLLN